MPTLRFVIAASLALLLAGLLAVGCAAPGSSSGGPTTPTDRQSESPAAEEPSAEDGLIPPEKVDELTQYFKGKNSAVSRCYAGGEASADKKPRTVRLTVALMVGADGTPRDVKISQSTSSDEALKSCVTGLVAGWQLPAPGQDMAFSHGYAFEAE